MAENNFADVYKTLPVVDLLEIIEECDTYVAPAIEAARSELQRRQLTQPQLDDAMNRLAAKRQKAEQDKQRLKKIEDRWKSAEATAFDTVNMVQRQPLTPDKYIRSISILFFVSFALGILEGYEMLFITLGEPSRWDLTTIPYLTYYILLPAAAMLLWRRKTSGWILAAFFISYFLTFIIITFLADSIYRADNAVYMDLIDPIMSVPTFLILVAILGSVLWLLSQGKIRTLLGVGENLRNGVIAFGAIAATSLTALAFWID